ADHQSLARAPLSWTRARAALGETQRPGPRASVELVFRTWEVPVAYVGCERLGRLGEHAGDVRVALDETRRLAAAQAGHVLPHQHLGVAVRARTDTDGGDLQLVGDLLRYLGGDHLHHHGERTGLLQRQRVGEKFVAGVVAALHPVAAQRMLRLGREADVRHHRDARVGQRLDLGRHDATTLALDRVRQAFLHEPHAGG